MKKSVIKAYISRRECPKQEVVLSELKLRRIFPAVYFVNTNLPEQRTEVLLNEKELNKLPDESAYIFKMRNTNRYIDRSNARFCNGRYSILDTFCLSERYSILDTFCFAEFLAYSTLIYKPKEQTSDEYQPNFFKIVH